MYDIDNSGTLDKDETRKFVQEYIPDMKNEWEFDELAFGRLFIDVDKDKTGHIKRYEMSEFLRRILSDEDKKDPSNEFSEEEENFLKKTINRTKNKTQILTVIPRKEVEEVNNG